MSFLGSMFGGSSGAGYTAQGFNQQQNQQALDQSNQAMGQQQNLVNAIQAQQPNVFGQQQQLANQLQQQANGQGPNPAQDALNMNTGANTANQAALMAGQRGVGANAGLVSRNAGMQGAANQQNAIGQGATLQAQQQLGAQQQLMGQQAQMAGQQQGAVGALNQNAQGMLGHVSSSINNQNSVNGQIAQGTQHAQGSALGGLLGGLGTAAGMVFGGPVGAIAGNKLGGMMAGAGEGGNSVAANTAAKGGEIGKVGSHAVPAPKSNVGNALKNGGAVPGQAAVKGDSYNNDTVQARLSPGEVVIPKHIMEGKSAGDKAKKFVEAIMAKKGLRK